MSRRGHRIWISVLATVFGLGAVMVFGYWLEVRRDTDLADASDDVAAAFRPVIPDHAPALEFVDVADEVGIRMRHGSGRRNRLLPEDNGSGLAWGDYDGDGDPDLYLVNFPRDPATAGPEDRNRLFRNDGGRFTDVTDESGVGDPSGFGMGASFADYDRDGDLDLYVTNNGPNRLFRNRGDGSFEDVAEQAGVDDALWSTGVAWGDYDRDGHLDLYVCNYVRFDADVAGAASDSAPEWDAVPFSLNPNSFDPQPNRLYRNRGDGSFEDVAAAHRVDNPEGRSLAATFCDLDGDGWLDLYVNNDVSQNVLFLNLGSMGQRAGLRFAEISARTGTADPRGSMGLSVADVSGEGGPADGNPDLFITHWVAQENALYQALLMPDGDLEFRDKTRQFRLGEVSTDTVGWGSVFVDLDLDGKLDIAVANGSTLERRDDPTRLVGEPMFLFWRAEKEFHDLAPAAGKALQAVHTARGLAAADYDRDGDVDLAVAINGGSPLLLRNEMQHPGRSLAVLLRGPDAARFGARVEVSGPAGTQTRWWGADVSYLSMHSDEMIFGLGAGTGNARVRVTWADGEETAMEPTSDGRVVVRHPHAVRR